MKKILQCYHLSKLYKDAGKQPVYAVSDVSFDLYEGEIFGLVGESGCGKSTLGQLILRLQEPTSGAVFFRGDDIATLSRKAQAELRKKVQIIFQNPYASLDPRMTVGNSVREGLDIFYKNMSKQERIERVRDMLRCVGLDRNHESLYPSALSGGKLQRVAIAQAMVMEPELVVFDEPVSALDVSVQAQVLNLLKSLQEQRHLTYLFISHNMDVVFYMSDRIGVMYLGSIVETGPSADIAKLPLHPYTSALTKGLLLSGEVPDPADPPSGCPFHTRCPFCRDICRQVKPEMEQYGTSRFCACHFAGIAAE